MAPRKKVKEENTVNVTSSEVILHKCGRGETLMSIAAKYNVPVDILEQINGHNKYDRLAAGTTVKVSSEV